MPVRTYAPRTCVCVIGVGYVGQSLLENFGRIFDCIGYDISDNRIEELVSRRAFEAISNNIHLTTDESYLSRGTHYLISVPTPLKQNNTVNLDHVRSALRTVVQYARPQCCIIIESSVPVGTTRQILGPYANVFHCGMSPERIDPGRIIPSVEQIPKVVSALTKRSLKHINALYSQVFEKTVPVSKPEVAEMSKLYENCYRMINIAYVNEISDACSAHGIDAHEMINAAATKPFGFQPFYPGIGVGGHCIPVNPFYLLANNSLPILEKATKTMLARPAKIAESFYQKCIEVKGDRRVKPRVLIVGLAFKPGQKEISGSPALTFASSLHDLGCSKIAYYDPLVKDTKISWLEKVDKHNWNRAFVDAEFDGIVACIKQNDVDFKILQGLEKALYLSFIRPDEQSRNDFSPRTRLEYRRFGGLGRFNGDFLQPLIEQMQQA
jgi:nucleotide sugar dehydrogenase